MVTCFSRWGLTVNEDTPTLYFPVPTPGMMLLNDADCHSVFRPSLAATALNSSTSKPFTVLPSVSRNSLGAYVESVPMVIVPSLLTEAGTWPASCESTDDWVLTVWLSPPDDPPPQAASSVRADTRTVARARRREACITVRPPSSIDQRHLALGRRISGVHPCVRIPWPWRPH